MFKIFKNKLKSVELEEAGLLSAIWILASNDENPIMTYKSIIYRLDLSEEYDVKDLIKKRSELFRHGVPAWRLREWKEKMLTGSSIPAWIKEIKDETERKEAIRSLSSDDVFRSQFRAKKDTTQSPIELIDWGLQHIERVRKAKNEGKELRWKWLKEGLIPILSIIVALGTVAITSYFQYENIQTQKQLKEADLAAKQYELSFKPKQEGYTHFMQSFGIAYDIATKNSMLPMKDSNQLIYEFRKFESAFFEIEPFVEKESKNEIWNKQQEFGIFLTQINNGNYSKLEEREKKGQQFREYFREKLNKDLFNQTLTSK